MKSASCSQPPLWNDRLLFLRFNPSSFVFIFFSLRLYFCQQQCSGVGFCWAFFFSRENLNHAVLLEAGCLQLLSPNPAKAHWKHSSFCRSLHLHYWATQCLTTGMHLNSSWNCLPSKLGKKGTELQGMATISQKLASWVGKWKVFYPNQWKPQSY